jgi:hypothetical protein
MAALMAAFLSGGKAPAADWPVEAKRSAMFQAYPEMSHREVKSLSDCGSFLLLLKLITTKGKQ